MIDLRLMAGQTHDLRGSPDLTGCRVAGSSRIAPSTPIDCAMR